MTRHNVLILGASYGSLLGAKLAMAGHNVTLVCLPAEVQAINREGAIIRMPTKAVGPIEINSRDLPGQLTASAPSDVDLSRYDLVSLAMQEPQYGSSGVRELISAIATARIPTMSIMNMPPLVYLKRISSIDVSGLTEAYTDASVWQHFDPDLFTLGSPDPQAFRPPEAGPNVLQVTLPTNFKMARFASDEHTAMLRKLQADIEAVRFETPSGKVDVPVKLKVHESVFVPLAKWAMLMTGNYRCVTRNGPRSIQQAVHSDIDRSRSVYEWVIDLCVALGALREDMVPFEKYAQAANGLTRPSSAARALSAGARNIERVDRLVQAVAAQNGRRNQTIDEIVTTVDEQLIANRALAAE